MRKKLLAFCDSPTAPTGFAKVAREILSLVHLLYDVDITIWGINHDGTVDERFTIIASTLDGSPQKDHNDPLLNKNAFCKYIYDNDFDVFWSVQDSFNMQSISQALLRKRAVGKTLKSIFYFPVDVPMIPDSWCRTAMSFDIPVVYTEFGKEQLSKHVSQEAMKRVQIAYHGTQTDDFFRMEEKDVLQFRKEELHLYGNQFLFMNLNRNQMRKDIPTTMFAFQQFMVWWRDQNFSTPPPKLLLHMHPNEAAGENLAYIRDTYMPDVSEHILFPDYPPRGFDVSVVNKFYNAADCLVSSSLGEGWGLTTTEAMCAKTPIVVPNNTVNPEILGGEAGKEGDAPRGKMAISGNDGGQYWNWRWIGGASHYGDPPRPITSMISLARQMKKVFVDCTDENGNRLFSPKDGTSTKSQVEEAHKWAANLTWNNVFDKTWKDIFDSCLDKRA